MLETVLQPLIDFVTATIGGYGLRRLRADGSWRMDFLIPSEAISPFAGYLVSRGEMSLFAAVAAGVLGNLVGSWIAYVTSSASGTGGSCGPTTGATSGCAPAPAA